MTALGHNRTTLRDARNVGCCRGKQTSGQLTNLYRQYLAEQSFGRAYKYPFVLLTELWPNVSRKWSYEGTRKPPVGAAVRHMRCGQYRFESFALANSEVTLYQCDKCGEYRVWPPFDLKDDAAVVNCGFCKRPNFPWGDLDPKIPNPEG